MQAFYTILIATLAAASNGHAADSLPLALSNKLKSLAGPDGQDCGSVPLGSKRDAAIACARNATSTAKPYRVAVQFEGVDARVWQGAARDEQGKLWVLYYDTDPSEGPGASPTLSAVPCREIQFEVQGGDLIDCKPIFARDPDR